MSSATAHGVVTVWHPEEGWGAISAPEQLGTDEVWAHFSAVRMPGYRALRVGQAVAFTYSAADQDGYRYVADSVEPT